MPPGWYDDPWSPAALRWWDGTRWTPHTTSRGPFSSPELAAQRAYAVASGANSQRRWRPWARASLIVWYGLLVAAAITITALLPSLHHQFFDNSSTVLVDSRTSPSASSNSGFAAGYGMNVLGYLPVALEIPFIVWFFISAKLGGQLGLPARRSPIWAILGFIVPVVSFWFPYQVAADLLPPGDPQRRIVGWWWAFHLVATSLALPLLIIGLFVPGDVTVAIGVVDVAVCILAMYFGLRMINATTTAQQRLAGQP